MSEPTFDRDPFEVVAESFLARFRSGERPGIEEYVGRHPELAEQIRELFPALVMVEQDLSIDRGPRGEQPAFAQLRARSAGWETTALSGRLRGAVWGWSTRPSR